MTDGQLPCGVESGKGGKAIIRLSFSDAEGAGKRKKTQREMFLKDMERA